VKKCLLLLASSTVEGIGHSLASIAKALLSRAEDAVALVLSLVAAGAGGVAELLSGGLLILCTRVSHGTE
jgi:hypothetical protein